MRKFAVAVYISFIGSFSAAQGLDPVATIEKLGLGESFIADPPRIAELFHFELDKTVLAKVGTPSPINDSFCQLSFRQFQACYHAMAALLKGGTTQNLTLIPIDLSWDTSFGVNKALSLFTHFSIVQLKPEGEINSVWEYFQTKQTKDHALVEQLQVLYETQSISFAKLYQQLLPYVQADRKSFAHLGAVNSFIQYAVDPHSAYLSEELWDEQGKASAGQTFYGLGMEISKLGKFIVVANVRTGSPAEAAKIYAKDRIAKIDGKSVEKLSVSDAVGLIRGPNQTQVTLEILRGESGTPIAITATRGPVTTKPIELADLQLNGKKIRSIKLNNFGSSLPDHYALCNALGPEISGLSGKGYSGIIFDVRRNPGGLMSVAICVGSFFLGKEVILFEQRYDGTPPIPLSERSPVLAKTNLPVIVLQNGGSASASEILSGAIQDHKRGWVVGTRSFGKGSVQTVTSRQIMKFGEAQIVVPAFNDYPGLMAKYTTARFLQPSGRTNQRVGIDPDFEVFVNPNPTEEEKFEMREAENSDTAISAQGPKWQQTRPNEVATLKDCVKRTGQAEKLWTEGIADAHRFRDPDYQLLWAQDLMNCVIP